MDAVSHWRFVVSNNRGSHTETQWESQSVPFNVNTVSVVHTGSFRISVA